MLALCIESSHQRGMGHAFRALALAEGLRERGIALRFFVNEHPPTKELIVARGFGFDTVHLDRPGEWEHDAIRRHAIHVWVNDRLHTELEHALAIKRAGLPLITFDDRGPGSSMADVNIAGLVFEGISDLGGARVLQGIDYLVLNPGIGRFRRKRSALKSILVTLGGSDTYGVTLDVVKHLASTGRSATVVAGPGFMHIDELSAMAPDSFVLKRNVPSLMEEFHAHDLAITGGGMTPFEAAASGLPVIVIASEPFEIAVGRTLASTGAAIFAGYRDSIDWSSLDSPLALETMSENGLNKIGVSGRDRVIDAILNAAGSHE